MFRLQGKVYAGLAVFSLGILPDRDAKVTSTASALLIDVRTGYVYGLAEATAHASELTNAWDTTDAVDRKRIEAERLAVQDLVANLSETWKGIVKQHAKRQVKVRPIELATSPGFGGLGSSSKKRARSRTRCAMPPHSGRATSRYGEVRSTASLIMRAQRLMFTARRSR